MANLTGLATHRAPSLALPLSFVFVGLGSLATLALLIPAQADALALPYLRNPAMLVVTHLITLGWASAITMGAMYQLVPVVLEQRIYSENLGRWHFALFGLGLLPLLTGFWLFDPIWLAVGGSLVVLAVALFLGNMALTLASVQRLNIVGHYLAWSLTYFGTVVSIGLLVVFNLRWGFLGPYHWPLLGVHLALGGLGWFTLTIIGVGYRLLPMFALSRRHGDGLARPIFYLLNSGIIGLALSLGFGAPRALNLVFALLIGSALLLFAYDARRIWQQKMRRYETAMGFGMAAVTYLVLAVLIGLGLALFRPDLLQRPQTGTALAALFLLGWVTSMIMAQLYKILPFLIWQQKYGPKAGREPVPLMKDLVPEQLGRLSFGLFQTGLVGTVAGLFAGHPPLILFPSLALGAGMLLFVTTMLIVCRR